MYGSTDGRTARDRIQEARDDLDRVQEDTAEGCLITVATTFAQTTYPTTAAAYYACHPGTIGGAEVEGGGGSVASFAAIIYVYNLGTAVPPPGTNLIATSAGDRWTARWDG